MPGQNIVDELKELLKNKGDKTFIVQISPAIRVAIGEFYGMPAGENVIGRLVAACKKAGCDFVFDTNFGADITILEEANELVDRLKNNRALPMFTTCCPTWYSYVECAFPDLKAHLSTVKSPQAILASIIKSYFAEKKGIDPEKIVHVVIAPCLVKKQEAKKEDLWILKERGIPNIDYVLTTKEAVELFKQMGVDLPSLEDADFDNPLGEATGAGAIFGTTGGVMEAIIRTAYYYLTGKDLVKYELEGVRNTAEKKEGIIKFAGYELKIATINGMKEAKVILDELRQKGELPYQFVEVMACPMGCIGGAGQATKDKDVLMKRREALFQYDKQHKFRAAHQNPYIQELYKNYFGEVGSEKAKEFLHIGE